MDTPRSTGSLAYRVHSEPPWWARAPVWLAAGIVGVPSLIALTAGYFVAANVTHELRVLNEFGQSELYLMNLHDTNMEHDWGVMFDYIDESLRIQYAECVNAAQDQAQAQNCLSPQERREVLNLPPKKKANPNLRPHR